MVDRRDITQKSLIISDLLYEGIKKKCKFATKTTIRYE